MSQVFGPAYAQAYDPLYQDKDYVAECNLIDGILRRYASKGKTHFKRARPRFRHR